MKTQKMFLFGLMFAGLLSAESGKVGGMDISYETKKPLTSGSNDLVVKLEKDGEPVKGAKINVKAIMPAMPGMPKMDFKAQAKETQEGYEAKLNFPHGGTWQLQIQVESEGKKHTFKSSVDF